MVLLLVFMQLTRDLFAIAKFLLALAKTYITHITNCQPLPLLFVKKYVNGYKSVSRYIEYRYIFFTRFIVDEILSIAHHYCEV